MATGQLRILISVSIILEKIVLEHFVKFLLVIENYYFVFLETEQSGTVGRKEIRNQMNVIQPPRPQDSPSDQTVSAALRRNAFSHQACEEDEPPL